MANLTQDEDIKDILDGYLNSFKQVNVVYYQHLTKKLKNFRFKNDFCAAIKTCSEAFSVVLHTKVWALGNHLVVLKKLCDDQDIRVFIKIYFNHVDFNALDRNYSPTEILEKYRDFNDFKKQVSEFLSL